MVERGPEKAGVGGSIPSLATIKFRALLTAGSAIQQNGRPKPLGLVDCFLTFLLGHLIEAFPTKFSKDSVVELASCDPIGRILQ